MGDVRAGKTTRQRATSPGTCLASIPGCRRPQRVLSPWRSECPLKPRNYSISCDTKLQQLQKAEENSISKRSSCHFKAHFMASQWAAYNPICPICVNLSLNLIFV